MLGKLPYRPVINIPKTKSEMIFDIIGIVFFSASILFLIVKWSVIPDQVPGHFNGAGEVDRWGSKYELILLPIIGMFLFIFLSLLEKAPHMHNYPKRLNEQNVEQFYLQSRQMLNIVKNLCLVIFAFLIVQIVRVAHGEIESLGFWFLPVFVVIMFGSIFIGVLKQSRIK